MKRKTHGSPRRKPVSNAELRDLLNLTRAHVLDLAAEVRVLRTRSDAAEAAQDGAGPVRDFTVTPIRGEA